jgi:hypothetical protein
LFSGKWSEHWGGNMIFLINMFDSIFNTGGNEIFYFYESSFCSPYILESLGGEESRREVIF